MASTDTGRHRDREPGRRQFDNPRPPDPDRVFKTLDELEELE